MLIGGKSADQNVLYVLDALRRIKREGDGTNSVAIFRCDSEKNYFVQVLGQRGKRLVFTESVSNEFLESEHALNSAQMAQLITLGWNPPRGENRPNYFHWWTATDDADLLQIARNLMLTCTRVYGFRLDRALEIDVWLSTGYTRV
jgi:hypothetical protein